MNLIRLRFVCPVVAGLDDKNEPVLCTYDTVGCATRPDDFVVAGTTSDQLYGVCESFWKKDMVRKRMQMGDELKGN